SLEWQNRLKAPVAALLGSAAGGFALHQEELAAVRIALRAIRQLARKASTIERAFAPGKIAGLARSLAGACSLNGFVNDLARYRRVLFEECAQALVDEGLHHAGDVGVQLALGLAFKLRLRQLYANHCDQAFANIVSGEVF